jgi:hypothetical protein
MGDCSEPGGERDFAPSFRLWEATSGKPLWNVSGHPSRNFVSSLVVPKRVKTSGSRERPIGSLLYGPGVKELEELEAMGECIALGYSREPPVATFSGRTERQSECRQVLRHALKQLPSRR